MCQPAQAVYTALHTTVHTVVRYSLNNTRKRYGNRQCYVALRRPRGIAVIYGL